MMSRFEIILIEWGGRKLFKFKETLQPWKSLSDTNTNVKTVETTEINFKLVALLCSVTTNIYQLKTKLQQKRTSLKLTINKTHKMAQGSTSDTFCCAFTARTILKFKNLENYWRSVPSEKVLIKSTDNIWKCNSWLSKKPKYLSQYLSLQTGLTFLYNS